jgi:hypothetical protein
VVVERLRGGDHDRLARVDPEGVEVLHVAHGDAVAIRIAHNLHRKEVQSEIYFA